MLWFGSIVRHADFGGRDPYFERTDVHRGSAVLPSDRVSISFYRA